MEENNKTLDMLIKNEEMAGELYKAYAAKFPEEEDFWISLAEEEKAHALWIRKFYDEKKDLVYFNEERFKPQLFEISMKYMAEKLEEAKDAEFQLPLKEALSVALGLESGMIERGYFEAFETDSIDLKETLRQLSDATIKHTDKIRNKDF